MSLHLHPYGGVQNPMLLPKIRSEALILATHDMPCTLRLASFLGRPCAGSVMAVHLDMVGGKGIGTKVTDLAVAAGCDACHRLLDGRDRQGWTHLLDNYPTAFMQQCLRALVETQARLVAAGIIIVKDQEII